MQGDARTADACPLAPDLRVLIAKHAMYDRRRSVIASGCTSRSVSQQTGALSGNAALVFSRVGEAAHLEVVAPLIAGGLVHFIRPARAEEGSWIGPIRFSRDLTGAVEATAMIQSTFADNLEVVARMGRSLKLLWFYSGRWFGPMTIPSPAVTGIPAMIQSTYGVRGNFEIVVPLCTGRIGYLSRQNDDPQRPWTSSVLGRDRRDDLPAGRVSAVSLVQGSCGLEVVARYGADLDLYWRNDPASDWSAAPARCYTAPGGAPGPVGNPVLVAHPAGSPAARELIVPWSSGGLAHFYRETEDPIGAWIGPTILLPDLGPVDDLTMAPGPNDTLNLIARATDELWFASRDSRLRWQTPVSLMNEGPAHRTERYSTTM